MSAAHLLHYTPGSEGYGTWRLECVREVGDHFSFMEMHWPDLNTCHCTDAGNDCESCREGDHGGCGYFGAYIDEIGYECRCEKRDDECWVTSWFHELGAELMYGDDWPEDVLPLPVTVAWNGGSPEIRYCSAAIARHAALTPEVGA